MTRRRLVAGFDRGSSAAAGTVAEAEKQEERTRQLGSNKFTAITKHGKVIWNNLVSMLREPVKNVLADFAR